MESLVFWFIGVLSGLKAGPTDKGVNCNFRQSVSERIGARVFSINCNRGGENLLSYKTARVVALVATLYIITWDVRVWLLIPCSWMIKVDVGLSPQASEMFTRLQSCLDRADEDDVSDSVETEERIEHHLTSTPEEVNGVPTGGYKTAAKVVVGSTVTRKDKFAIRCAMMARAKVGRLTPTKANELVYQRVLLDHFDEINLRLVDRDTCMARCVAACFITSKEWDLVDEMLEHARAESSSN
nr:MAG: hypothetical protein [Tombusviridae sp.]